MRFCPALSAGWWRGIGVVSFNRHGIGLFVLSGASVAALAIVSISGPVDLGKIGLITFGSLTAAIAAPMIENSISPKPPESSRTGGGQTVRSRREAANPSVAGIEYTALKAGRGQRRSILGRDDEFDSIYRRLVRQQKAGGE
jgi:hypothetical protein